MEIYERIRYLRRDVLHMTMEDFGKKIGVSRDVVNNIERNRLSRFDQKLPLLKLIALVFNIREEWLLTGDEPMVTPPPVFTFDAYFEERRATLLEKELVRAYFGLPEGTRHMVAECLYEAMMRVHDAREGYYAPSDGNRDMK